MHQQGRAALALDDRADRGPARADDQITLPMPGNGAVRSLDGTFGEHDISGDMPLRAVLRSSPWPAQRAAGPQAGDELAFERTTALDEQRLVDRLVADAHGLILREVDLQSVRDLLRAPRQRPPPADPMW